MGPAEVTGAELTGAELTSAALIGRASESHAIDELLAPGPTGPRVLALVGEPGSGRTFLLTRACETAARHGRQALTVAGVRGEENIPLASLSQLLLPFVVQIESLPDAHRLALERPLGLVSQGEPFDLVATGMAVLALMTQRPESPALFVAVDDADHVDDETLSVLAFVAKRMDRQRAVLLLTAEPAGVPAQFERNVTRVRLERLADEESLLLLERKGPRLGGRIREQIVAQSAGSPLVLLETALAVASPRLSARPRCEPLRLGPVVEERVLARLAPLPQETRRRLLDLAVAESYGWTVAGWAPVLQDGLSCMEPAEAKGIVRIDQSGVRFTHPALWITIYHTTPFSTRVEAHRRVADSLADRPRQRAWHLGRAATEPDETVASLLEVNAVEIGRQLGRLDEALSLERAAELSPDSDESARRYVAAAVVAAPTGELRWVDELMARAEACVRDPQLRVRITTTSAYASAARGRFSAAMAALSRAADEAVESAPEAAWEVLSIAAAVGYQSGSRATHARMLGAVEQLAAIPAAVTPTREARSLWIESYLKPGIGTADRLERLERLMDAGPTDESSLSRLAGAAWLDDESESAYELANAAYPRLVEQGAHAAAAVIGPIRSWTSWDSGRWDDALVIAAHASRVAEAAGGGMLQSTGDAVAALVHAARADADAAERHVVSALALIEGEECRSIAARVEQARGVSDLAGGNYAEAYGHLSRLFREDGTPLHWHISYFGIADLAAAALRAGQLDAGRVLMRRILKQFPGEPATRMRHLRLRAEALLAETDAEAEASFAEAQADPAGSRWPFERAQLLLDYGAWLRRRRRVGDAKVLLTQAHEIFEALGATTWAGRTAAELRASHVDLRRPAGSLDELTAQQREIVLLAGQGLTNREIASRLYLSPRTVASHLYRSFPKLGIRDRWQLRDVIDQRSDPDDDSLEAVPVG